MPILFAGGEDLDYTTYLGGASSFSWSTSANAFRSGYARGATSLFIPGTTPDTTKYAVISFAASSNFWATFRMNYYAFGNGNTGACRPLKFFDSSGVERIRVQLSAAFVGPNDTFVVQKVNAAGTATTLGTTSTGRYGSAIVTNSGAPILAVPDKMDVFINYGVSGQIQIYNTTPVGTILVYDSGTVDTTTDGNTTLAQMGLGGVATSVNGNVVTYSEIIISTTDTRTMSLVTQAATANGNTHNWTAGTAANISAASFATGDASPNYSQTAAQIQQYTITPAIPTGNFSVVAMVHKARVLAGASPPTKFDFMVRTAATDFSSSDFTPTGMWATYQNIWAVIPNTTAAWATTDFPASSASFNYGLKSVT